MSMKQALAGLLSLMWLSAAFADTVQVEFSGVITAGAVSGELGGPYPTEINPGSAISGAFLVHADEAPFSRETPSPSVFWQSNSYSSDIASWITLPVIEIDDAPAFRLVPDCPRQLDCVGNGDRVFVDFADYPNSNPSLSFVRYLTAIHGAGNAVDWRVFEIDFFLYPEIPEGPDYLLTDNTRSTSSAYPPSNQFPVDSFSMLVWENDFIQPIYDLSIEFLLTEATITNLENPPVPIPVPMPFVMLLSGLMLSIPLTRQRGPRSSQ